MSTIRVFKQCICEQLSRVSGHPVGTLLPLLEYPKISAHGHVAIINRKILQPARPASPSQSLSTQATPTPQHAIQEIADKLLPDSYLQGTSVAGGYLNFWLNRPNFVGGVLSEIHQRRDAYGHTLAHDDPLQSHHASNADDLYKYRKKKILVEFSSPNIAKPFHAGHLRSTIIGNVLANLFRTKGADVVSINYLGDWGTQYGLLAVGFNKYGKQEELKGNPIRHLFDVYVQVNKDSKSDPAIMNEARAYFSRMEQGDQASLQLWQQFRDLSIEEYKKIYGKLGITFDVYSGESLAQKGVLRVLELLKEKNLLVEKEGAKLVDLSQYSLGTMVLEKSDGSTLYLTRDIAMAIQRHESMRFDDMYYVTGAEQSLHFSQLFKILELLGYEWASRCHHVPFGRIRGMSTREGNVYFLDDILRDSTAHMKGIMLEGTERQLSPDKIDQVAPKVSLSAVVVQDLQAKRIKEYTFDLKRMTDTRGDTGPYLQYTHARLASIERVSKVQVTSVVDFELLASSQEVFDIVMMLAKYEEVLSTAVERTEPSFLTNHLLDLARLVNAANHSLRVKDQAPRVAESRMLLLWCVRSVIADGLRLLGLEPLEEM